MARRTQRDRHRVRERRAETKMEEDTKMVDRPADRGITEQRPSGSPDWQCHPDFKPRTILAGFEMQRPADGAAPAVGREASPLSGGKTEPAKTRQTPGARHYLRQNKSSNHYQKDLKRP